MSDESADQGRNGGPVRTDPTFYRSAAEAVAAPTEKLAYVVAFDRAGQQHDALTVVDVDEASDDYAKVVGWADLPTRGDELHHFGWNACSSALMHAGHDMGPDGLQRRFLLLPGLRSSRIHVYDTQPDPRAPRLHKTVEAAELADKAGYSRPHTLHCGPDGVFLTCLGGPDGVEGPGGIALLDHNTFDVLRAWETDRGPQFLAYDAWWHLNQNTLISSEWGTPSMIEDGLVPELLLGQQVRPPPALLGPGDRPAPAERRPRRRAPDGARDPPLPRPRRDVGVRRGGHLDRRPVRVGVALAPRGRPEWKVDKVITIPPEPADPADLPPALQPFSAVPPLVTDIDLSVDDRMLYVSCWGTGELKQYDVSDPAAPREVGSVHLGGIVRRTAAPRGARPSRSPEARRWSRSAGTAGGST